MFKSNLTKQILTAIMIVMMVVPGFAKKNQDYNMNVLMVGIGAKNPAFDESKFPDLNIVFTPDITVGPHPAKAKFLEDHGYAKGAPEVLTTWWNEMSQARGFVGKTILLDKSGVGAWEGIFASDVLLSYGTDHKKNKAVALEKMIKPICRKDGKAKIKSKRKTDPAKRGATFALNGKMPEFDVVTADGKTVPVRSLVGNGKATLVVFFHIPADASLDTDGIDYVNIENVEARNAEKGRKANKLSMLASAIGESRDAVVAASHSSIFISIEESIFFVK